MSAHGLDDLLDVKEPVRSDAPFTPGRRLNLGSGPDRKPGWINVDADESTAPDACADVRTYLRELPEASVDEIYAGHFLEHLGVEEAREFLLDCFRVLKPGCRVGIVVPDTRAIVVSYLEDDRDLDDLCRAFFYSTVQESHHKWSYDLRTLKRALEGAGFEIGGEIDRFADPRLYKGAWWQCGLDGVKPKTPGRLTAWFRRPGKPAGD